MTVIPSIVGMLRTRQRKRLTKRKRSRSAPAILKSSSKRSTKRKVWTDTQMKAATDAVKSGANNVQSALSSSSIPCSDTSISRFLTSPHLSYPDTPSSVPRKLFPRARLLTSAACLAEMEEKERKKQSELEEKERKRKEREEKKNKKEEGMKKKAEERAKKAEEKTKKASSNGKRAVRRGKEKAITQPIETVASSSSDTPSTSDISVSQQLKKRRLQESEEIECCMCFGTYEEDITEGAGTEWISCACGRWLHEDFAENRVIESSGCERFCPFCVC